jgi:molybdopterin-guanine dinucleotide biosynthesis protein B
LAEIVKVFALKGFSKTGKTSVGAATIRELRRRGYTVGVVKNIHHENFSLDSPGTDTHAHKKSGAELVCARGPGETALIFEGRLPIERILSFFTQDFAALEGDFDFTSIITGKTAADIDAKLGGGAIAISGIFAENFGANTYKNLPVINGLKDTARLADLIIEKTPDIFRGVDIS